MNAGIFLTALGRTLVDHEPQRPQREAATPSSWMLFMQRVLADLAARAGLHTHVGDVFDMAFSAKDRDAWAPPVVTIAHDNEWTDAELSARIYEMLVGFAPLRVAFVYPDMPPDECVKRIVAFADSWKAPPTAEDLVLVGDPRGVHVRWSEWRLLRRTPGAALRDAGVHRFPIAPPAPSAEAAARDFSCLCLATREAWDRNNAESSWSIDDGTARRIMEGCDRSSSFSVTPHHHFSETTIDDTGFVCRTCRSPWKERVFHDFPGAPARAYFTPELDEDPAASKDASCACGSAMQPRSFSEYRTISAGPQMTKIIEGSDVVSRDDKAVRLRCRTCEREWMHRLWSNELAYVFGARLRRLSGA